MRRWVLKTAADCSSKHVYWIKPKASNAIGGLRFFVNFALECSHICDRPYLHVRVDPRAALACSFDQRRCGSDRFPIAAQTHRCRQEYRSDCQADPQARAAQETTRHEMCHRVGWEHIW